MSYRYAIADTCFLIDWARYRRRDILFQLFKTVFVPENVLREIRSEETISWIADALSRDKLALYTPVDYEVDEARRLVEESRVKPYMTTIDLPEALCLIIGRERKYIVLTENRGALLVPRYIEEYRGVVVWRSLEILVNAVLKDIVEIDCSDPGKLFREYSDDTLHLFPQKSLEEALREVGRKCLN